MSDLRELKFKRGLCKGELTRLETFMKKFERDTIDDKGICQLKCRHDSIEKRFAEFQGLQDEIEYILETNELENFGEARAIEEIERSNFEDRYFEIISIIRSIVDQSSKNDETISNVASNINENKNNTKLPTLKLPNFSGSIEKWLEFKDLFLSIVHNNDSIDEIQKFHYLKSCLSGEAAQKLESIPVTSSNYSVAFTILKEAYENKRLIIETYVNNLFSITSVTKENGNELRNLYDKFSKNIRALQNLGQPVDKWDTLLVHLLVSKFDNRTRRDWEGCKLKGELPTVEEIGSFLKEKCIILEKLGAGSERKFDTSKSGIRERKAFSISSQGTIQRFACYFCKEEHSIFKCIKFLDLSVDDRNKEVNKRNLCKNCLNPNHTLKDCRKSACRKCNRFHNTLLHYDADRQNQNKNNESKEQISNISIQNNTSLDPETSEIISSMSNSAITSGHTISVLSTALVEVLNSEGKYVQARMLLDPGSQSNFINEKLAKLLKIKKIPVKFSISGIGNNFSMISKYKVELTMKSLVNDYSKNMSCLILPKITQAVPNRSFNLNKAAFPAEKILADPEFNKSSEIDILCGVGLFYEFLNMEQVKLDNGIILQNSKLGWIVGGEFNYLGLNLSSNYSSHVSSFLSLKNTESNNESLNKTLEQFWQIEECANLDIKDDFCEKHFINNFYRASDNRLVVKIPFMPNLKELGKSKNMAINRFYALERKLSKNDYLKSQYIDFIEEYERLGHLKEINIDIDELEDNETVYYVPHHPVLKESDTTPCRVVFDFSAKTDKNISLNDVQRAGPTIQSELIDILLRFRLPIFVMTADISKMYRQVWLDPEHTRFQRIFWRKSETEKLKCYELLTVTYGSKSSSFLATRALQQIANENAVMQPLASKSIKDSFYVDDYLEGDDNESNILQLQSAVTSLLQESGFQLRKWLTNAPNLIKHFNIDTNVKSSVLKLGENENSKTLGVMWNADSDTIEFSICKLKANKLITKRSILSAISQLFDPMGLLGPIVIKAKFLLQLIWKEKCGWDDPVSERLKGTWISFITDLEALRDFKVPRHVLVEHPKRIELHLFTDASEKGYGCCIYLKSQNNNEVECNLLCSKSRVAPIKQLTLPRLELSAALLGAKLLHKVKNALNISLCEIYCWTDSTIVYHWINGTPDKWKTFVANRVAKIQSLTKIENWHHVNSAENPSDIISRGITAKDLRDNEFWFHGPSWLKLEKYPIDSKSTIILSEIPETKIVANIASVDDYSIFEITYNLNKLIRITAYCLRFSFNAKRANQKRSSPLTVEELNEAFKSLLRLAQMNTFSDEIADLKRQKFVRHSSSISNLCPFLDNNNILRVGGRISEANLSYDKTHPIILPKNHSFTKSLMMSEHKRLYHCGPQHLLFSVREKFWPIAGRNLARKVVHDCVTCFKAKPKHCEYIMGNLPKERFKQTFPFSNVGCDYAGPFFIKDRKTRNPSIAKAWISIFVCMVTKALHLEVVTELTAEAFIACFKRFIARRGKSSIIFSDNGTQYTGANNELLDFFKKHSEFITEHFAKENITWKFIPPKAPNFGGVWESSVKSIKHHLKRVVGNSKLHFEDFNTVLCQIESILNSRPLTPLSSSPDDYYPLTPAHFLIGRPLTSIPEPDYTVVPDNRLKLYQQRQKMVQLFWKKWSFEYINGLQVRLKWKKNHPNLLKEGSMVIVKEDNLPPLLWKMARVVSMHPGSDDVVRVVSIRFSDGKILKRCITKLCVLPIEEKSENVF